MRSTSENEWLLLEEAILSGQVPEREVVALLHERPAFGNWFLERSRERLYADARKRQLRGVRHS